MTRNILTACLAVILAFVAGCRQEGGPPPAAPPPAAPPSAPEPVAEETAANPLQVPIPNARMLADDVLSGGQPTVEQFEQAAAAGFRTVVNLRTPGEEGVWDEAPKAEELGLRYVAIPVAGVEGLTVENARDLAEIFDDPGARPLMIHCGSGNRIGALFALKAYHLDGESTEAALEIGRNAGLTRLELEEVVKERLESSSE